MLVYRERIDDLSKNITHKFLYIEVRFQIVFNTDESITGVDFKYVIIIFV